MTRTIRKPDPAAPASVADTGKIRVGAGFGLLPAAKPRPQPQPAAGR